MGAKTDYAENKLVDFLKRGQNLTIGAQTATWSGAPTWYIALIFANKGYWAASTAYALNDYVVTASPSNGRLYKCTTAGTSGASAPTWPTTAGGTVTDGTAVWTEQTTALEAGTFPEVTGGAYARQAVAASLANWAGTQSAGSTTASSGTGGTTSNNNSIPYPTPTANWGLIVGMVEMDAVSAGNAWDYAIFSLPKTVNNGDAAPTFNAAALTYQEDN